MKKPIGIVRKLDSLGRVVIPKEIRREFHWEENQPMEMFVDNSGLYLKAYRVDDERKEVLEQLEDLRENTNNSEVLKIVKAAIQFIEDRG